MAWILLLWFTLMTSMAYRQGALGWPPYYSNDYEYAEYSLPIRRVDQPSSQQSRAQQRSADAASVRYPQRMNERSIAVSGGIQRIQEQERRRLQTKIDGGRRAENGTYKIVNDSPKAYANNDNRKGDFDEPMSDSVIFPGQTRRFSLNDEPQISEECRKLGFCEDVPNYPAEEVAVILRGLSDDAKEKFKTDETETLEIAQRIGPIEETELCDFESKVVYPKSLRDKEGKWNFIINPPGQQLQGIHVEVCKQENKPCNKLASFYTGYEAYCKQKYILRYMTGAETAGGQSAAVYKAFQIPSCCTCVVRVIENI